VIGCKRWKSAGRRRPVVKPDLGAKIRRWDDRRHRKNGRPRRLKEGETGSWSRPLECIAKKVLPLGVQRLGFYGCYLLGFRTQYGVTGRKAYREGADDYKNNCDPGPGPQAYASAKMFQHDHFKSMRG
jgi:hypothetical protein